MDNSVTHHPAVVTFPPLSQPIKVGTRFSDPGGMLGYIDLVGSVDHDATWDFLARDVIYTSRAYATMLVSICLWRKYIGAL